MNRYRSMQSRLVQLGSAMRRPLLAGAAIALLTVAALGISHSAPNAHWVAKLDRLARTAEIVPQTLDFIADIEPAVNEIWISGRQRTPRNVLLSALEIRRGDPIWRQDLAVLRTRLLALPWVRDASLRRTFSGTLYVRLVERKPCARWQSEGRLYAIDHEGVVLPVNLSAGNAQSLEFARLPLLVGHAAARGCDLWPAWVAATAPLGLSPVAAVRVSERRWDLVLQDGTTLMLPEVAPEDALARLAYLERHHQLLSALRPPRTVGLRVDLRVADRVRLRASDPQVFRRTRVDLLRGGA